MLSIKPVSLRPSGLAESPLFLIGLALRLFVAEPVFKRDDDFRRCGMMLTIFNTRGIQRHGYVRGRWNGVPSSLEGAVDRNWVMSSSGGGRAGMAPGRAGLDVKGGGSFGFAVLFLKPTLRGWEMWFSGSLDPCGTALMDEVEC